LNNRTSTPVTEEAIVGMVHAARAASSAGRDNEAGRLLQRAAELAPNHPFVNNECGVRAALQQKPEEARAFFSKAVAADASQPALWSNLANALHTLGLFDEESEAIEKALVLEPRHLSSLLQKGALLEAIGQPRHAATAYRNALATVPPDASVPPSVEAAVMRAKKVVSENLESLQLAIEERLSPIRQRYSSDQFGRAERCVDLLTGRRKRHDSQPTFMHFPELPTIEFFDRNMFPWLEPIEAATDAIRSELLSVLSADRAGLEPYVAYPQGVPLDQWAELNHSRRWSAYFLWNQGEAQHSHLARCPKTAALLEKTPRCEVNYRAPTAYFSILDAKTRIPAHTGVTNTRLTVHLPLIVPPGCGFRVGSEVREWLPGQAWVFDDTIEHEAWNESDAPRAILIFDIWNPLLTETEREVVRATTEAYGDFYHGTPEVKP